MDIILTGFMGTGKSTIGRLLGERYAMPFIDTDEVIENECGKSIEQIFSDHGEQHFRSLERSLMQRLRAGDGRVIATGGGLLADSRNHTLICDHQHVICLRCEPAQIARRLAAADGRPLLPSSSVAEIERLLRVRASAYGSFASIDTSHLSPEEVVGEIGQALDPGRAFTITTHRSLGSTIHVERGAIGTIAEHLDALEGVSQVLVVTDETVSHLPFMAQLRRSFQVRGKEVRIAIVHSGESAKTLETIVSLYRECARAALDRQSMILGVGGGVVCDMAGFVAATYLRGLRLTLAPTTLLAQVDAAIGGKTGVDFGGTKNVVGSFWPADSVIVDPDVLGTLPDDALRDGLAEVVKIGFMQDAGLVAALERLSSPRAVLDAAWVIRAASALKSTLVQRDPFERDERMLLNFGHTVGHAVEAASGYRVSHGHAVSIGMVVETKLGVASGWTDTATLTRLLTLLDGLGLPKSSGEIDMESVMRHLARDKKRSGERYRVAVPRSTGNGAIFSVPADRLFQEIEQNVSTGR